MIQVEFKTEDPKEALRLLKANDMAFVLWKLVNNTWRQFKHTDYDYPPAWKAINKLLEDNNINVEELYE